jgi:hypothetical protein
MQWSLCICSTGLICLLRCFLWCVFCSTLSDVAKIPELKYWFPKMVFAQALAGSYCLNRFCVTLAWTYIELLQFTVSNQTAGVYLNDIILSFVLNIHYQVRLQMKMLGTSHIARFQPNELLWRTQRFYACVCLWLQPLCPYTWVFFQHRLR